MKIIDLTWRLPGPLSTYLLAQQGMEVIKYEDRAYRDPFLKWDWDPAFAAVYNAFQEPKEVRLIDFGSVEDIEDLHAEIATADAVVMSLPERVEQKLGITSDQLSKRYSREGPVFMRLGFRSDSNDSAHDLNTLAQSQLLRMHLLDRTDDVVAPPFLPVTGIFFSHHIAISLLALVLRRNQGGDDTGPLQEWCWLQESVEHVRDAYYPETVQSRRPATFLHNGRFPCYNIYRTADNGYLAMACVEPKFWNRFRELTGLEDLSDSDGLCEGERSDQVKKIIFERINRQSTEEWRGVFADEDVCVDLVDPEGRQTDEST